jgi:hypothetical protein
VHNPTKRSIPFCKPVSRVLPKTKHRGKNQEKEQQAHQDASQEHQEQPEQQQKQKKKYRLPRKKYTGGGNGVKFSTYIEPSMMFSMKERHLGPGCYPMSAQAALDLEPRKSPIVKFRPLSRSRSSASQYLSSLKSSEECSWPRPLFKDPEGVNKDNFEDFFWSVENRQNARGGSDGEF